MNSKLDQAAENHTSVRVSSNPPAQGRLVFKRVDDALDVKIINSGVSYSANEMKVFGELIQILQEEGQLSASGSIPIANLMKM